MDDLDEFIASLPPDRQQEITRRHAAWCEAERAVTLAELRQGRGVTQVALAEQLGRAQNAVSRIERQQDTKVSTLRQHIEALGGRLVLAAVFDDEIYVVTDFLPAEEKALADSA